MRAPAAPLVRPTERVAAELRREREAWCDTVEVAAVLCACDPVDVRAAEAGEALPADVLAALCARYRVPGGWVAAGPAGAPPRLS